MVDTLNVGKLKINYNSVAILFWWCMIAAHLTHDQLYILLSD